MTVWAGAGGPARNIRARTATWLADLIGSIVPCAPVSGTGRKNIHEMLEDARRRIERITPQRAHEASLDGGILIDTRSEADRADQGTIAKARHYPLSVLEWMLDPESGQGDGSINLDSWIILICKEGYSSSLAAARLKDMGFGRATDVIDGVAGWKAAGLPIGPPPG
jgi:rhodanese-related sulfurtransferase